MLLNFSKMALTKNEQPATVSLAANPIWVDYSTDEGSEDFIGIHIRVSKFDVDDYCLLGSEMRYEPDAEGKVQVDIQSLLEWDPDREFSWPEKTNQIMTKRNDLRRLYKINAYEKFGNPLSTEDGDEIENLYVLPGKISDLQHGLLNDQETTWFAEHVQGSSTKFLTNSSRIKTTDAWASERLYFFFHSAPYQNRVRLKVVINYSDGGSMNIEREVLEGINQYDVVEILTSFSTLGLHLHNQTKEIDSYRVYLTNSSHTTISESFTYKMDHVRKENSRYLIFSNAFKMYEGVRLSGSALTSVSTQFDGANKYLPKGYGVSSVSRIKGNISEEEIVETSSDWLNEDEAIWMRELLLSKEVYEIVNGQLIPIQVITSKNTVNDDNSNLRALNIAYRYGHKDKVPSIIPVIEDNLENFISEEIIVSDMTNSSTVGYRFEGFTYNDSDGSFYLEERETELGHASSPNLPVQCIPLILSYSLISEFYTHNDLNFTLTPDDDIIDHGIVVEVPYREENGYGPLIHKDSLSKLVAFEDSIDDINQISGVFILYVATKRYLEYLYENR